MKQLREKMECKYKNVSEGTAHELKHHHRDDIYTQRDIFHNYICMMSNIHHSVPEVFGLSFSCSHLCMNLIALIPNQIEANKGHLRTVCFKLMSQYDQQTCKEWTCFK